MYRRMYTIAAVAFLASSVTCIPKFSNDGFKPSTFDYMKSVDNLHDQMAVASDSQSRVDLEISSKRAIDANDISDRSQKPRFGSYDVTGSQNYGVSSYGPAKIDLGGLLLGAIIGVGSILVIPKILYVLSGTYGSYARSDEGGLSQAMMKLDDALSRYGIDTTSCMQRLTCSYTKHAAEAVRSAEAEDDLDQVSSFDKFLNTMTSNNMLHTALQGTAIQDAMDAGRSRQNCARLYHHCQFSMETMLSIITKIAATAAANNMRSTSTSTASAL